MAQYLMSVWMVEGTEPYASPEEMEQAFKDVEVFNDELKAAGKWVFAGGLHPASTATVVKVADGGDVITTDGPFAETKEQLGGFWVIRCDDLDQALSWAEKCALACGRPIEVRPFNDGSGE